MNSQGHNHNRNHRLKQKLVRCGFFVVFAERCDFYRRSGEIGCLSERESGDEAARRHPRSAGNMFFSVCNRNSHTGSSPFLGNLFGV